MNLEQLFHHCFICDQIGDGDLFPAGGNNYFHSAVPLKVEIDFANFYENFNGLAEHCLKSANNDNDWKNWAKEYSDSVDLELLTTLQAFTFACHHNFMKNPPDASGRIVSYKDEAKPPKLSDLFAKNQAECVEYSLLAKKFLDDHQIESQIMSGEMLRNYVPDGDNFTSAHTFLIIKHKDKEFIFDPANPSFSEEGTPILNLSKPCKSLSSQIDRLKQSSFMVEAENIITHRKTFYGVGCLANIYEKDMIFSEGSAPQIWCKYVERRTKNAGDFPDF